VHGTTSRRLVLRRLLTRQLSEQQQAGSCHNPVSSSRGCCPHCVELRSLLVVQIRMALVTLYGGVQYFNFMMVLSLPSCWLDLTLVRDTAHRSSKCTAVLLLSHGDGTLVA
jgi:hypothetical protein